MLCRTALIVIHPCWKLVYMYLSRWCTCSSLVALSILLRSELNVHITLSANPHCTMKASTGLYELYRGENPCVEYVTRLSTREPTLILPKHCCCTWSERPPAQDMDYRKVGQVLAPRRGSSASIREELAHSNVRIQCCGGSDTGQSILRSHFAACANSHCGAGCGPRGMRLGLATENDR